MIYLNANGRMGFIKLQLPLFFWSAFGFSMNEADKKLTYADRKVLSAYTLDSDKFNGFNAEKALKISLAAALKKLEPFVSECELFRVANHGPGLEAKALDALEIEEFIRHNTEIGDNEKFISFSKINIKYEDSGLNDEKKILIKLVSYKSGIDISRFSTIHSQEEEILFLPQTKFRIRSFDAQKKIMEIVEINQSELEQNRKCMMAALRHFPKLKNSEALLDVSFADLSILISLHWQEIEDLAEKKDLTLEEIDQLAKILERQKI